MDLGSTFYPDTTYYLSVLTVTAPIRDKFSKFSVFGDDEMEGGRLKKTRETFGRIRLNEDGNLPVGGKKKKKKISRKYYFFFLAAPLLGLITQSHPLKRGLLQIGTQ